MTFPEEEIFTLKDLTRLYEKYARHDSRLKEFVEKITDFVRLQNHQPLHSAQINELVDTEYGTARIAVLLFDTDQNGQSYDILVKDLEQNELLPVLIVGTDGEVAFDKMAGFYYTQVDPNGRGARIFRHQVGTDHKSQDVLIYDESANTDFSVSISNSLSKDLILMNIETTFKPRCNEIWVRSADFDTELGNKFFLVQPMQPQVQYQLKHSGDFLYKYSNEDDLRKYKITKIRLPNELKVDRKLLEQSQIKTQGNALPAQLDSQLIENRLGSKYD